MRLTYVFLVACSAPAHQRAELDPQAPNWTEATPESVGLDKRLLDLMMAEIESGGWGKVHAVVIARHGRLVHESYFAGDEEHLVDGYRHVEFGPDIKHGLRSVSKSFTATLIGVAIDQGLIESVDLPLVELLPEYSHLLTGEKAALTLRHVLTMSAGLSWAEGAAVVVDSDDDQYAMIESEDPVDLVLGRELESLPGTKFGYSSGLTQVLSGVLERMTGMQFTTFADSVLFYPLGISDWEWISWGNVHPAAFGGLRLSARDMAKLGQVYLDDGQWQGQSIVSAPWVAEAMSPLLPAPSPRAPSYVESSAYGFQWWYDLHDWNGRSLAFHTAIGNGGQRVIVIPDLALVVAVFAGFYDDPSKNWVPESIVRIYVLPAISDPM
jgi:CubicO group peptidase (beta-lactamase class C family)